MGRFLPCDIIVRMKATQVDLHTHCSRFLERFCVKTLQMRLPWHPMHHLAWFGFSSHSPMEVTVRGKKASVAVNRRFRVDPRIICLLTHLRLRLLWRRRRPRPSSMVAHIVLFPMLCIRQMVMTPTQSPLAVCQRLPPNKTANDDITRLLLCALSYC